MVTPDRVLIAAAKLRVTTDAKQGLVTPARIRNLATQGEPVSETYIKAEIVRPKKSTEENVAVIAAGLFGLAFRTLIVWWALAAWFPELGITYWQAILPVYAIRMLVASQPIIGRQLTK